MTYYHLNSRIYLVDREEPIMPFPSNQDEEKRWTEDYETEHKEWLEYIAMNCKSYECRVEGLKESTATEGKDFVWRYEWMPGVSPVWVECTEEEYNKAPDNLRRKVAVAPPVQPEYNPIKILEESFNEAVKTVYGEPDQHPSPGKQAQNLNAKDSSVSLGSSAGKQEGEGKGVEAIKSKLLAMLLPTSKKKDEYKRGFNSAIQQAVHLVNEYIDRNKNKSHE